MTIGVLAMKAMATMTMTLVMARFTATTLKMTESPSVNIKQNMMPTKDKPPGSASPQKDNNDVDSGGGLLGPVIWPRTGPARGGW